MVKLNFKQKKEGLSNALVSFGFPEKYFIQNSDGRLGQKFAIASNTDNGGVNVHTNFMTYDEMNCFFIGYHTAINNQLK